MKKPLSIWLTIITILVASLVLIGLSVKIGFDKGIETERQIAIVQVAEAYKDGYDRGYQEAWRLGYNEGISKGYWEGLADGQAPYKSSTNTTISVDKALAILAEGKRSHQYYIDHPDNQNFATGDTVHNQLKVQHYADLEELVKWLSRR